VWIGIGVYAQPNCRPFVPRSMIAFAALIYQHWSEVGPGLFVIGLAMDCWN
jgi:hypothetical protein